VGVEKQKIFGIILERERKRELKMMNVNLSLTCEELELLSVSLRLNLPTITDLADAECLDESSRVRYRKQIEIAPRVLDILTKLQVQRMMFDFGAPVSTVNA
jgi:hypothetical protein